MAHSRDPARQNRGVYNRQRFSYAWPRPGMLLLMNTFAKKTVPFGYADNLQAQFVLLQ